MDTAVGLVRAYLELAGYFVLAELPVRAVDPDGARDLTDLDVVAVRFPRAPGAADQHADRPLAVFLGTGLVGGGGLGDFAIRWGYYRYETAVMFLTVALMVVCVQVFQFAGNRAVRTLDKRI